MEKQLSNVQNSALRKSKILSEQEVALQVGDIFIAFNPVTLERRQITVPDSLLTESSNRQVLKD